MHDQSRLFTSFAGPDELGMIRAWNPNLSMVTLSRPLDWPIGSSSRISVIVSLTVVSPSITGRFWNQFRTDFSCDHPFYVMGWAGDAPIGLLFGLSSSI